MKFCILRHISVLKQIYKECPSPPQSFRGCIRNSQLTAHYPPKFHTSSSRYKWTNRLTAIILTYATLLINFNFPSLEDLPVPQLLLHFTGVQMNKLPSSAPQRHFIHPGNKKKWCRASFYVFREPRNHSLRRAGGGEKQNHNKQPLA